MTAVAAPARFGRDYESGVPRRLHLTRVAYLAGAACVALGLLVGAPVLLALGAALVNLGTIERFLAAALDVDALDVPLVARPATA